MQHKLFARYPIGNPRRKWKQDNFVLSIANPGPMGLDIADEFTLRKVRRAVKTCTDAGFNLLECLWASPAVGMEIVRTAESVGNRVVFQDLKRFGGMGLRNVFCEKNDPESAMEQIYFSISSSVIPIPLSDTVSVFADLSSFTVTLYSSSASY